MNEQFPDPTPREVADTHAELIKEHRDLVEKSDDREANELELSSAKETVALEEAILSLGSSDEVKTFMDSQAESNDTSLLRRYKDLFEQNGFGALHDQINQYIEDHRAMVDTYENAVLAKTDPSARPEWAMEEVKDYSERFRGPLVTAALAEAALDGVQINHPDAINIQK